MRLPDRARIFCFFENEQNVYDLQIAVLQKNLWGAPDALSLYTCHSLPHVQEVMEQADRLFETMREWLIVEVGLNQAEMERSWTQLLLAAKLHDVGMAGSKVLRELLNHVDEMHDAFHNEFLPHQTEQQRYFTTLKRLARQADNECSHWDNKPFLCNSLFGKLLWANPRTDNMSGLLAEYHELIKSSIRKYHGENTARWIMENKGVLQAHYGANLNWDEIALMAALHTGDLQWHTDEHGTDKNWKDYCYRLCQLIGIDDSVLRDEHKSHCMLALVSILRLADQRRTGSRLLTMAGNEIRVFVNNCNMLRAEYQYKGVSKQLEISRSNRIILSEKLNEFGPVSLEKKDGEWVFTHRMTFALTKNFHARSLLIQERIPLYLREMADSMLKVGTGIRHIIYITKDNPNAKVQDVQMTITDALKLITEEPYPEVRKEMNSQEKWLDQLIADQDELRLEIIP